LFQSLKGFEVDFDSVVVQAATSNLLIVSIPERV
jgi:hypothetical protein